MKALVGAFNQEKALVGAFSVIVQPVVEPMDRFTALVQEEHGGAGAGAEPGHAGGEQRGALLGPRQGAAGGGHRARPLQGVEGQTHAMRNTLSHLSCCKFNFLLAVNLKHITCFFL